jgi:hypothetical protein
VIEVHVVPQGDAWALVVGNQQESFDSRHEAIRCGRELAEQQQGKLVIHGGSFEIARTARQRTVEHAAADFS